MTGATATPAWTEGVRNGPLAAHATRLGPVYDLSAAYRPFEGIPAPSFYFERGGLGLAGVAGLTVPVPSGPERFVAAAGEVRRALSSIERPEDGPGPVAVGAFPFADDGPSALSVTTWCVRRIRPGETWKVEVPPAGARTWGPVREERPRPGVPSEGFDRSAIRPDPSGDAYASRVGALVERIRSGVLRKAVLARSMTVDAGRPLDTATLLWRLRAVDPDCFTFAVATPGGVMVGATPELLVSRQGDVVRANPLAGSAPRFGDPDEDRTSGRRLLDSAKERNEHAMVSDAVASAIEPFCTDLRRAGAPELLGTANVWHLSTPIEGRLREPLPSVLEIVGALHPTPAVCGEPREEAMRAIRELEPFDRGTYAGPVGWADADGNGEWAIALRCAEVRGREARLFAGAGIVAESDPAAELDETERKFRALLDALRWG